MSPDELRRKVKLAFGDNYKDHEEFVEDMIKKMNVLDIARGKVTQGDVETECDICHLKEVQKGGWAFCPWCGSRKTRTDF